MAESGEVRAPGVSAGGTLLCQDVGTNESLLAQVSKRLEAVSPSRVYRGGAELYRQGAVADEVFFVERGLVKLTRAEEDGQELIVDLRFPGSLLGVAPALTRRRHPLTAVALTKSHVRRVEAKAFCRLLQSDTRFSWHVHQLSGHEISHHLARVAQLGCLTARHRLEQLFRQLITADGTPAVSRDFLLRMPLKQWEVAQLIAVTPAYLSRLLNQLELEGLIRRERGAFAIPEPRRLWRWKDA